MTIRGREVDVRGWAIRLAVFVAGIFISAFGVALSTKSGLGISPLTLPAYVLSQAQTAVSMGQLTILQNVIFVVLQIILLRRAYRPVFLLQLPMAVLYGEFVDLSLALLAGVDASFYPVQAALCLLSVLVTGFGVFLTVKANVVILAGEGIVSAIAQVTRQEFGKMKIAVDCSLLALGAVLSLALFRGLVGIREGTVVAAVAVGLVVQLCGRRLGWLDRLWAPRAAAPTQPEETPATPAKPHLVITIAREFGPNGVKIAHALARELGLKLYDEELVDLAIRESGLDPDFVRKNEERLSHGLLYDLYAQSFEYAPGQQTADDALFQAQQRVIRRLAAEEDCVILGRSANFILGKGPGLFHVYLHADPKWRLAETMEEFGLKEGQARALLTRTDSERARRYRHNTGRAWGLASDYDLCLDVSGYGVERSARLLRDAVRSFVYAPGEGRGCPAGENVIQ